MSALTYATAQLLRVIPRARVGQAIGRLAERPWSPPVGRAIVALYSRMYRVELGECSADTWGSFDSFFTRELRQGARLIAKSPRAVVSPADGRIESMGRIDQGSTFMVKGRPYRVDELVGDPEEAKRYAGGTCAVIYLSPRDYHRVHAPVAGYMRRVRSMPGDYFPVNSIGVKHVPNLFVRNRRVAFAIDTPDSGGLGRVTVVMVAAIVVGRITATGIRARDVPFGDHFFDPPRPVDRGDEIGVFHLGSTAVLLLERGAADRWVVEEGPVRFGQEVASSGGVAPAVSAPGGLG